MCILTPWFGVSVPEKWHQWRHGGRVFPRAVGSAEPSAPGRARVWCEQPAAWAGQAVGQLPVRMLAGG